MNIYISYWAQVRNFPANLVGLNTTVFPPKWRPLGKDKRNVWVIDCPPLKPGSKCANLCNGQCEFKHPHNCQFLQTYYSQLTQIDFASFLAHLKELNERISLGENLTNIDFALLVFETPSNLCSERWPLKRWFKTNGYDLPEWQK